MQNERYIKQVVYIQDQLVSTQGAGFIVSVDSQGKEVYEKLGVDYIVSRDESIKHAVAKNVPFLEINLAVNELVISAKDDPRYS